MKIATVIRNGVTPQMVDLIGRLVKMIPWPERRAAMGDVIISLLDGKPRLAEDVFCWNRKTTELGCSFYTNSGKIFSCTNCVPGYNIDYRT